MVIPGQWPQNKAQAVQRKFFIMDKALNRPRVSVEGR